MPIGTYTPPLAKALHNFFFKFFYLFFFHFRCILLQISHQKCFCISISIPGRSGHSAGQLTTKIRSQIPFFTELLRVQLLETCLALCV